MKLHFSTRIPLFCLGIFLLITSCREKKFDGDSITNYPDINMIFREYLKPYQKSPYTFQYIENKNGKIDSSWKKAEEVDWASIEKPFRAANLYNPKLDGHYIIDVMNDTLRSKMTLLLTAIDPKAYTRTMSITATSSNNKIQTLYAETRDIGFITSSEYKLLYVVGKSIQIQEIHKTPWSGIQHHVRTLRFLN
ncbi:MAG TPA: hypothetical protein PLP14_03225 [Chitinophagaceae bacterium]|nr:hypothetical protein [Chitinophagaceae bacterium]